MKFGTTVMTRRYQYNLVISMYFASILVFVAYMFLLNFWNGPTLFSLDGCLSKETSLKSPVILAMMVPVHASLIASVVHDAKTYLFIKSHVFAASQQDNINLPNHNNARRSLAFQNGGDLQREQNMTKALEIPLKATIYSSIMAALSFIVPLMASTLFKFDAGTKAQVIWAVTVVSGTVRNPVISREVIKSNEVNRYLST